MNTYIATSDGIFNLPSRQEFEDGTVIEKIFDHIILIRTENNELIDWLGAVIELVPDDFYTIQTNDAHYDLQWSHHANANGNRTEKFWARFSNYNWTQKAICIIDTGVASHPDLNDARITINYGNDTVYALSIKNGIEVTKHIDINDNTQYIHPHGTHVAGIACAALNNQIGVAGVYKNKLFSINVFQEIYFLGRKYVGAYTSSILKALSICKNNADKIRTINMSLGGGWRISDYNAYLYAFQELYEAGIMIVMAAGNSGYEVSVWRPLPAYVKTDNSFTIASSNVNGQKSWFSNYDSYLCEAMVAGGSVIKALLTRKFEDDDILSCLPHDCTDEVYNIIDDGENGKYGYMSGTSMASPYCAGLLNIVYELMEQQYPNKTFGWYVSALKKLLIGATYKHTEDLFDQCAGGGIIDASLLNNSFTAPLILSVNYDNEILSITINNFTGAQQTLWISIAANQFVSPFEQSTNTIYTGTFTIENGQQTININIDSDTYFSIEKAGILTAYWNGSSLLGCYGKWRIYNSYECPTSTCRNVYIRCDDNTYIPLKATNYPLLNASLLSTLAERTQKRFLFFFESVKNQQGKWTNLYPVSTAGVCLNTINYPNASHPFQCRIDADENDVMYAYYALYTQWRDIYEKGFVHNGMRWFVFDYDAWLQSNRTLYKRKLLPDDMKFDESFLRKDKIGQVVRAINMMIFWAKIIFAVQFTPKYVSKPLSVYGERFKKERGLPIGASFILPIYNGGIAGMELDNIPTFRDNNNYKRVRWKGYYFQNPYYDDNPGDYWHTTGNIQWISYKPASFRFLRLCSEFITMQGVLISAFPNNSKQIKWVGLTSSTDKGFGSLQLNYYFGNLPNNLYYHPQNNITYYQFVDYNPYELINMEGTLGIVSVYADKSSFANTQCEPTFMFLEESLKKGGRYDTFNKYGVDTIRIVTGNYGYISHNLTCPEIVVPISLQIKLSANVDTHSDSIDVPRQWALGDANNTYNPPSQSLISRFKVTIKLYSNGSYQTVFEKKYTITGSGGSYSIIADTIVVDVKTNEHILVIAEPDYDVILRNPTHSLIVPRINVDWKVRVPIADEIIYTHMRQDGYEDFERFELRIKL